MIWVRKGIVFILSAVLFISLVGEALSLSVNLNLTSASKLETWLGQSQVYTSVVDNAIKDAQQNSSNDTGAGRVSLSDPQVASAIKSVFSPSVIQGYADQFLTSNYAWLKGNTAYPSFRIDLTTSKQKLANQLGQVVQARVAGLAPCTSAQLSLLQTTLNSDPLTLPCGLPGLSSQTAAAQVGEQIATSRDFIKNPVLTAGTLNPNGGDQGQPYYQKFRHLPKLYQLSQKLPIILAVTALISLVGIVFISLTKRRGVRRLGWVFLASGVVLVALKFVADSLFSQLEKKIFNNSNIGQLQKSLTTFLRHVESQLVKVDLYYGVGILALAVIILAVIWLTRDQDGKPKAKTRAPRPEQTPPPSTPSGGQKPPMPALKRPAGARPGPAMGPAKRPRPRLIQ